MKVQRTAVGVIVISAGLLACGPTPEPPGSPAAATVQSPRTEAELTTVTLAADAERRLGIRTEPVRRGSLPLTRTLGGEVLLPVPAVSGTDTASVAVRAPLSTGDGLQAAQALIAAQEEVDRARVGLEAARTALTRAERVQRGGAGSARAVDEAGTTLGLAQATLGAAEARLGVLTVQNRQIPPIVWIRVPIYVGDLDVVDPHAEAQVSRLGHTPGAVSRAATPVSAPHSANPDAATVDLFYELTNSSGTIRPGEKVAVTLALQAQEESLIVPWSAVVRDIHGGEWVYEQIAPRTFTRRRVQVRSMEGALAALATGPEPDALVVTSGAAELFGTEFGVGK